MLAPSASNGAPEINGEINGESNGTERAAGHGGTVAPPGRELPARAYTIPL